MKTNKYAIGTKLQIIGERNYITQKPIIETVLSIGNYGNIHITYKKRTACLCGDTISRMYGCRNITLMNHCTIKVMP